MTATSVAPTASMQAKAASLLHEQTRWTHATRKSDGRSFWMIPASKPGSVYYTDASACTCKSFQHRGVCSHSLAVAQYQESAADVTHADVGDACDIDVEIAFADLAASKSCRRCHAAPGGASGYCRPCRERLMGYDDLGFD